MSEHIGGLWDNSTFTIERDYAHEIHKNDPQPCPHAHSPRPSALPHSTNYMVWTIPRVVIVENEGGHNSTGVCLDCVLVAAASIVPGEYTLPTEPKWELTAIIGGGRPRKE